MKSSLALALLLCALPLAAQAGEGEGPVREALPFVQKASLALDSGARDRAAALLVSALELAPDFSEALYLRARLELQDRAMTAQAIADLRAALQNASWVTTDPAAATYDLAETLLRTVSLTEARALAAGLAKAHPEDPRNVLLLSRILAQSGNAADAGRTLVDAMATFPLNENLRLLDARFLARQGQAATARNVVATGLKVNPDSLPLLLATARLEKDPARKRAAVDLYLQKGGSDPEAALIGLEVSTTNKAKYLDSFVSQAGLGRQDLVARAAAAVRSSKTLSSALQDALSAYRGNRDLDANGDGYWDERWVFGAGSVVSWRREPFQDGKALYSAQFSGNQPKAFTYMETGGDSVTLRFSTYPWIDSAALKGGTYLLVPYTLQCSFLRPPAQAGLRGLAPLALAQVDAPSLARILAASHEIDQYAADGATLVRRVIMDRGRRVFMEEDENGDGVLDHRVWYENGAAVRGEKSLLDNGEFPVKETWRGGAIVSESVDTNGDGRPDFRQTFGATPMKGWDYDEDGKDDSRELPGPGGTVVRELSTALNGVFDLRIVMKGALITAMTLHGAPVAVVQDPARGVTWIGQPAAAGARIDLAQPDGIQIAGGRQYLVFRSDGVVYAEVLR